MIATGLLIREGTSDEPLGAHLEALCVERGIDVVISTPDLSRLPSPPGKGVTHQLSAALELMKPKKVDVVFIHRDADGAGVVARRDEINSAVEAEGSGLLHIPVIPVRMTEAWLLLDEQAIRDVAGNPQGRVNLNLPTLKQVESIADPKATLMDALKKASEERGRRLSRVAKQFSVHRQQLLDRLDRQGPVSRLASWRTLCSDLDDVVPQVLESMSSSDGRP